MYTELTQKLRGVAQRGDIVYYKDIAPMLGLDMKSGADRGKIGEILGEISKAEHDEGRPLLSAVVILKEGGRPGKGFFALAKDLGHAVGDDHDRFFIHHLRKVHDYWATH